jgi:multiple sugar transport system substrate-binding protein
MMMKNKTIVVLVAVAALACMAGVVFAAPSTSNSITFLSYGAWRVHPGWDQLIAGFEKANNANVTIVYAPPAQIYDKLVTMLSARSSDVDVIVTDTMWMPSFTKAGFLAKLPADQVKKDEFLDVAIKAYSYKGDLYAVPQFCVAGFTFYRTDLFEKAGLDPKKPPKNWDDLLRYAKALTIDTNGDGNPDQWGYGYCGLEIGADFLEFMWQNGGDVLDDNGNVTVNSPAVVEALQFFVDLRNKYKVVPPGVITMMPEDLRKMFISGQMAMLRNWPYVWATTNTPDSPIRGKVVMIPNPGHALPTATTFGAWGLAIPEQSKNKELAAKFVAYMTSYEGQKKLFLTGGEMPARKAVYDDPDIKAVQPNAAVMLDALLGARNRPMVVENQEVLSMVGRAWQEALTGLKTPKKALDDAAAAIKKILK